MTDYLTPGAAALLCGVHPRTIANWCDAGLIEAVRLPSGHRRISRAAIAAFLSGAESPTQASQPADSSAAPTGAADTTAVGAAHGGAAPTAVLTPAMDGPTTYGG